MLKRLNVLFPLTRTQRGFLKVRSSACSCVDNSFCTAIGNKIVMAEEINLTGQNVMIWKFVSLILLPGHCNLDGNEETFELSVQKERGKRRI